MSIGTIAPPIMKDRLASVDEFPDHANVLAIIRAYMDNFGPMPWPLLVDVVGSLPSIGSDLQLTDVRRGLDQTLVDIVSDLRSLGFVELTPAGTMPTAAADEYIRAWNGRFATRKTRATEALEELRFV